MRRGATGLGAIGLAFLPLTLPVAAVDLNLSRLSRIELGKCVLVRRHRDGNQWRCPGLPGYPVHVAEGDLRYMMGFGPQPARRTSARQTLGAFNTIFRDNQPAMIEWRVERHGERRIVPYATIVRYWTSRDGETGEALVITKVNAKDSCQLAVIDVRVNTDAMAIARAWAVAEARKQPCPAGPQVIGAKGKGPL